MRHTTVAAAAAAAAANGAASSSYNSSRQPYSLSSGAAGAGANGLAWPAGDEVGVVGCGDLWREAAQGFSAVVKAGLPAVNIVFVNQHQAPAEDTWPVLAGAFEMFLLGQGLPQQLAPPPVPPKPRRPRRRGVAAAAGSAGQPRPAGQQQQQQQQAAGWGGGEGGGDGSARDPRVAPPRAPPRAESSGGAPAAADGDHQHAAPPRNSTGGSGTAAPEAAQKQPSRGGGRGSDPGSANQQQQQQVDIRQVVLDTLIDNVLSACGSAPRDMWRRLVAVVAAGADGHCLAAMEAGDAEQAQGGQVIASHPADAGPSWQPFSHLCLRRLSELCARGSGARGADACLLEVAQLALPSLLERCESALDAVSGGLVDPGAATAGGYLSPRATAGGGGGAASFAPATADEREVQVEDALCALDVLLAMRLEHAVLESITAARPYLANYIPAGAAPQAPHHWQQHALAASQGSGGFLSGGGFLSTASSGGFTGAGGSGQLGVSVSGPGGASPAGLGIRRTSSGGGGPALQPGGASSGAQLFERSRAHLLAVYASLVRCICCGDGRVVELVQLALAAAGEELGLGRPGLPVGGAAEVFEVGSPVSRGHY